MLFDNSYNSDDDEPPISFKKRFLDFFTGDSIKRLWKQRKTNIIIITKNYRKFSKINRIKFNVKAFTRHFSSKIYAMKNNKNSKNVFSWKKKKTKSKLWLIRMKK